MTAKDGGKTLKTSELRRKSLELRTIGLSYQQIADQLGCSKSAAPQSRYLWPERDRRRNQEPRQA